MNLAEIRKKAQKEKNADNSSSQPGRPSPENEIPEIFSGKDEAATEETVWLPRHEIVPFVEPETCPDVFDPVALLLAGRAAARSLEETPLSLDAVVTEDGDAVKKYLCFRVADEQYAISLMEIKEIIKPREVTEVPRVPAFVEGIISLRGIIIPVLDMRERLGFQGTEHSGRERFVIVKKRDGLCGLRVDEVYHVIGLAQQPIEKPPAVLEGRDREFVSGIGRYEERIYILMDLEKVLDITLL
jgi:purine-binding chemotaxis protein CheW